MGLVLYSACSAPTSNFSLTFYFTDELQSSCEGLNSFLCPQAYFKSSDHTSKPRLPVMHHNCFNLSAAALAESMSKSTMRCQRHKASPTGPALCVGRWLQVFPKAQQGARLVSRPQHERDSLFTLAGNCVSSQRGRRGCGGT